MPATYRREISLLIAIACLLAILAAAAPGFFTLENQSDLLLANMSVLIAALGMMLVVIAGHIDISIGSQFAICTVAAGALAKAGLPMPLAALLTVLIGGLLGALNGTLTAYLRIPSIVATLATMVALRDTLRWITGGAWVDNLPGTFQWFGLSRVQGHLLTVMTGAFLTAIAAWALANLPAARAVYATGSNADAARLVGINTRRVTLSVFAITGALTAAAAVLNAVRFNQAPSNAGLGLEMKVIAAVVVGGVAITGGRGTVAGVLLGVILLGIIGPALAFLGVSPYWERALQGGTILIAVALDLLRAGSEKHAGGPAPQQA